MVGAGEAEGVLGSSSVENVEGEKREANVLCEEVDGVERTTKEWPAEDRRPGERWPKYRRLDGSAEDSDPEGKNVILLVLLWVCS